VLDDFNREGLGIEVDLSLPATRVIRSLDQIIEWRGKPGAIRCDNGPEYISGALLTWAEQHGIKLDYIQPGKLQQNAYVERYNQHRALRLAGPNLVRIDRRGAGIRYPLAMDVQPRAPEHGTRWHHPNAETGTCRLAPLLESAKSGGITAALH